MFESELGACWTQALDRSRRGYRCTAALSELVDELERATRADIVFFDAGPNIGPLNRAVLLDCTHFIVPVACDLFSSRALKTLGFALSTWVTSWHGARERAPDKTPLLGGKPQLLGFIPQGFRVYRGEMAASSLSVLSRIESRLIEFVWRPLQAALERPTSKKPTRLKLGQVKFLGTLATEAQNQGKPLWEVAGGNADGKASARDAFTKMARQVLSQIN